MCGITGFIGPDADLSDGQLGEMAALMACSLEHRGPDDAGVWADSSTGVALGFRRLAILDLSDAGHQPMTSADGRYTVVFNGEIYNHRDLRHELGASHQRWRGHSDTETLLAGFVRWGIEATVQRSVGMFAFAVWDRDECTLTLGRDRFGEKPLYFGWAGAHFVFASELKAIRQHPQFAGRIDRDALAQYFRFKYIPDPRSIFEGIWKLPPGSLLAVTLDNVRQRNLPQPTAYWSLRDVALSGALRPFRGDADEAKETLRQQLQATISGQMVADVPLGAFLSGGVDSATIVALMQQLSSRPVQTYTIGFTEPGYDEAPFARAVAKHLGTEHTELYVTPDDAMAVIPSLPRRYDEPFADSSQIPTVLVSHLASQHVTVSLSGDGGDEVFGGYNRYLSGLTAWNRVATMPRFVRRPAASLLSSLPPSAWSRIDDVSRQLLPRRLQVREPGEKAAKLSQALRSAEDGSPKSFYRSLVSDVPEPTAVVPGACEPPTMLANAEVWAEFTDVRQAMMFLDAMTYLPGDILTKVDRAAMSESLETRVPYLDHRVVELAWSLPMEMKIERGHGKRILRDILYESVPRELIERPKTGFGIPLNDWLRGPLAGWVDDVLQPTRLRDQGYLAADVVDSWWREHKDGIRNHQHRLWSALMFQSWLDSTS